MNKNRTGMSAQAILDGYTDRIKELEADLRRVAALWNEAETINQMDDDAIYEILDKYREVE